MTTISWLCIALIMMVLFLIISMIKYRNRVHYLQGKDMGWPIRTTSLENFNKAFKRNEFGPSLDLSEVNFIGEGDGFGASTSDFEAWILAVLSKTSETMFEFGTCTGRTAYLWAKNSPTNAKISTLTLSPEQLSDYQKDEKDQSKAAEAALRESCHMTFVYSGTDVAHKISQIFSDSKKFDEKPFLGQCDLIFIDGSHAYSYAKSDTEKALRMLKPGGIVLWHDYNPLKGRSTQGVYKFLNELNRELPLVRLRKTSLVAYQLPVSTTEPSH